MNTRRLASRMCELRPLRWRIADHLSRWACALRGHKWYLGSAWHGVPGNRATELVQTLWTDIVILTLDDTDKQSSMRPMLDELAQLAGENWGHIEK